MTWNVTYGFYLVAKLLYKMHASLRSGDVRCFVNLKYSFAIFCLYRIFWTRIRFFWFRRLTGVAMKANAIFSIFSTTICKILGPAIEDCWFDRPEKNKNHVDNHRLIQVVRISLIIHSSTFPKFKKKTGMNRMTNYVRWFSPHFLFHRSSILRKTGPLRNSNYFCSRGQLEYLIIHISCLKTTLVCTDLYVSSLEKPNRFFSLWPTTFVNGLW